MALKQNFANPMLESIPADFKANIGQRYVNWSIDAMPNRIAADFEANVGRWYAHCAVRLNIERHWSVDGYEAKLCQP